MALYNQKIVSAEGTNLQKVTDDLNKQIFNYGEPEILNVSISSFIGDGLLRFAIVAAIKHTVAQEMPGSKKASILDAIDKM